MALGVIERVFFMLFIFWLFFVEVMTSILAYTEGVPKGYYTATSIITGNVICMIFLIVLSIIVLSSYSDEDKKKSKYYWLML